MQQENKQKWRPLAHVQMLLHLLLGCEVIKDVDRLQSVSPTSFIIIATRQPQSLKLQESAPISRLTSPNYTQLRQKFALLPEGTWKIVRFCKIRGPCIEGIFTVMVLTNAFKYGENNFFAYSELHVSAKHVAIFRDVNYKVQIHEMYKIKLQDKHKESLGLNVLEATVFS